MFEAIMGDLPRRPAEIIFLLTCAIVFTIAVFMMVRAGVKIRAIKNKEAERQAANLKIPLITSNTGMVYVKEVHILQTPHEHVYPQEWLDQTYLSQQYDCPDVINYVFPLSYALLQSALRDVVAVGMDSEKGKNIRRALTIASAVYQFGIPTAFVLLDAPTVRMYQYYAIVRGRGYDLTTSMKHPSNVDAMKTLWEQYHAFEKQIDVGNDEDVRFTCNVLFPIVAERVLELSLERVLPYPQRVVKEIMKDRRLAALKITTESDIARAEYMVHVTLSVACQLMRVLAPMSYLHFSPFSRRVIRTIRPTSEQKPVVQEPARSRSHLRVVASNEKYIPKETNRGKL